MQTKPKSNSVVTVTAGAGDTLVFDVRGAGTFTFDPASMSAANHRRAMLQGVITRISNGAAIARDKATGASASPAAKFEAIKSIADHLASGSEDWSAARVSGAGRAAGGDRLIVAAVAEARGVSAEEVRALVAAEATKRGVKPGALLAALATAKAVAPILARMRAAESSVDADEVFEGLMGDAGTE